jgi:hypothetical protein
MKVAAAMMNTRTKLLCSSISQERKRITSRCTSNTCHIPTMLVYINPCHMRNHLDSRRCSLIPCMQAQASSKIITAFRRTCSQLRRCNNNSRNSIRRLCRPLKARQRAITRIHTHLRTLRTTWETLKWTQEDQVSCTRKYKTRF